MLVSQEGNLVTLINVFETRPEQQQALIDQWIRFTEEVKKEPGYIGTALHRSKDGTRVINYAQWRSDADFDSFLKKYGQQFADSRIIDLAVSYQKVCHPMNVMWVSLCSVQGQALVLLHAKYISLVAHETKWD